MRNLITFIFLHLTLFPTHAQDSIPEDPKDVSPLLIGEFVPDYNLKNVDGDEVNTKEILSEKPTVLILYRGGWCPYCNVHLSQLQEIENDVIEAGFQILAVSPDNIQNLHGFIEKNNLKYQLLSDPSLAFATALGLTFKVPDKYIPMLKEKSGGENPGFLPVPALFIVDKKAKILFEYINPDYSTRISGEMLLAVLQSIKM